MQNISLLISVYVNEHAEYLTNAFQSIVDQTQPAEQVVLVCDGVLTQSLESVIEEFSPLLPFTIVRILENVGLARALNVGLSHCRNEWIARFDSDDLCEPRRLEIQGKYIKENIGIDVFGSSILEFAENPAQPYACRDVFAEHNEIVQYAKKRNPMNHMTVVYRKSMVLDVGGYPLDHMYEDYALWVNLIMHGCRFGNIKEPLVRARAGTEMADRRGGLRYLKAEFVVQRRFRSMGFITTGQFLYNVALRGTVRLAPSSLRRWAYATVLRKKAIANS